MIRDETPFYCFNVIESIRSRMLLSAEKISVNDFGTGGTKGGKNLFIQFIARNYVKPAKYGQLLFRLVNEFHPENILEIGTSLGITTMYLASARSKSRVITMEGCENTSAVAAANFKAAGIKNIEQVTGEFSKTLPSVLKNIPRLDFVYFDGNHRKDPTLFYFKKCLENRHENSVFVFDDIHWSNEMQEAWKIICDDPSVSLSIDLFSIGIVFFRSGFQKQNFVLKY